MPADMVSALARQVWPVDGLEQVKRCPVCGASSRQVLYEGLTDRVFFSAPGRWSLHRCEGCGSAYLDPRPTEEAIGLAYGNYYTHASEAVVEWGELKWHEWTKRALANGYRNHRFGLGAQPATRLGVPVAMLLGVRRAAIDAEGRNLPRAWPRARILDVGCGNGSFLELARSAGWNTVGVDIDPRAVEIARARGMEVHLGSVDVLPAESGRFDVITLSHVIEHVHDPLALLQACRHRLKPNGWIWLQTPNLESQGHARYRRDWRGLEPPRHLVLFTPRSIRQLLAEAGFEQIRDEPYVPLCRLLFSASEAIAAGHDPNAPGVPGVRLRLAVRRAERLAQIEPYLREFITVAAR